MVGRDEGKELPPAYEVAAEETPPYNVGMTELFKKLDMGEVNADSVPETGAVVCHLKLLEAFYCMRQEVEGMEGLFVSGDEEEDIAKEWRWAIFVSRAVDRFEKWWNCLIVENSEPVLLKVSDDRSKRPSRRPPKGKLIEPNKMPPLDVLMVWHAFLLNPMAYAEDCWRFGVNGVIWNTEFPWRMINESIDSEYKYRVTEKHRAHFESKTGLPWDNLDDDPETKQKMVQCVRCRTRFGVRFSPVDGGASSCCYTSNAFEVVCPKCNGKVTHDTLRVNKFINDVASYEKYGTCLPATLVNVYSGLFNTPDKSCVIYLAVDDPKVKEQIAALPEAPSMMKVRSIMDAVFGDEKRKKRDLVIEYEGYFVRRFMSHYWDNSSSFSIDLEGAVHRQGTFIQKMHQNDWLHSPSLFNTVPGMIEKYANFFQLIRNNSSLMAVPTLDVDLVWHTHQLSANAYFNYSIVNAWKFVDHDDKVKETTLTDCFTRTVRLYESTFKKIYSECMCWLCLATREHRTNKKNPFSKPPQDALYDATIKGAYHPSKSDHKAHISTHNAVPDKDQRGRYHAILKSEYDEAYKRVQKRAKKLGRPVPPTCAFQPQPDDSTWHAAEFNPSLYSTPPLWMADEKSSYGDCCSGTCGAAISAGGSCTNGAGPAGCGAVTSSACGNVSSFSNGAGSQLLTATQSLAPGGNMFAPASASIDTGSAL